MLAACTSVAPVLAAGIDSPPPDPVVTSAPSRSLGEGALSSVRPPSRCPESRN